WEISRIDQVIDMLGLQGDAVDNIPGVKGIGPKAAVDLLQKYGSLEGVYEQIEQEKGSRKDKLVADRENAFLSKRLARIEIDAPIEFDQKALIIEPMNKPVLKKLFTELEFRSLAKSILDEPQAVGKQQSLFGDEPIAHPQLPVEKYTIAKKNIGNTPKNYQLCENPQQISKLVSLLSSSKEFCFDTETSALDPNETTLVGIAFSVEKDTGFYIPIPEDRDQALAILAPFKPLLESSQYLKIGQNIKYDLLVLKWYNVEVAAPYFDTMIAHYLLEPDQRHKLDHLSETLLGYHMVPIEELIGSGKNQGSMRDVKIEKAARYAAEDADITFQLKQLFEKELKEQNLLEVFNDIEMPLIPVLADMEFRGVRIDPEFLKTYSVELSAKIKEIEKSIYLTAGVHFNIDSPKQVGEVLFLRLKIPYRWRMTSTGQYSTNEEKLAELSTEHNIVAEILEYRKLQKLKNTYIDTLPYLVNKKTGRVHSSYNQARAATGRLSSEKPNLQNIPVRDEAGREIRKAFQPADKQHILLAADYSQIELRLIADMSGEPEMLDAFRKGLDIHRATAAKVYNVSIDDVSATQRRNAKTVNFSIIYGAGATNLSQQLKINRNEAKVLIDNYFERYAGLKKYMDDILTFARENNYVLTKMGRKRWLRDINSGNGMMRSNAERMAINTPIQGTAADMIKMAMIHIQDEFRKHNLKSHMIMQVHDELVFDVFQPELETVRAIVTEKMKNAIPGLQVPILVDTGTGDNWLQAH
ncbi:MAG TPA: DNA polymerase I, partial [Saprospiraceae bacterium]|nr:DNA polymerase I [Saprospiraceae bacterium]